MSENKNRKDWGLIGRAFVWPTFRPRGPGFKFRGRLHFMLIFLSHFFNLRSGTPISYGKKYGRRKGYWGSDGKGIPYPMWFHRRGLLIWFKLRQLGLSSWIINDVKIGLCFMSDLKSDGIKLQWWLNNFFDWFLIKIDLCSI